MRTKPGLDFCYWCDDDLPHMHADTECTLEALRLRYADLKGRSMGYPDIQIDGVNYSYHAFRDMQDQLRLLRYENEQWRHEARRAERLERIVDKVKRYALWIGNDRAHGVMDKLNELISDV